MCLSGPNGKLISAKPYVYVNWAKEVDLKTGKPVESDFSRYTKENALLFPSPFGGHNWQPMAYNPKTKLVYIPVRDNSFVYGNDPNWNVYQFRFGIIGHGLPVMPTKWTWKQERKRKYGGCL